MKIKLALLLLFVLLAGCITAEQANNIFSNSFPVGGDLLTENGTGASEQFVQGPIAATISVSTDKQSYGSSESVMIVVEVVSSEAVEDTVVRVWGITVSGKNHIESQSSLPLKQGSNMFLFKEQTPQCTSGCGGVHPGKYTVSASVEVAGKKLAESSTEITLTQ